MHHFFKERITLKRIVIGIIFLFLLSLTVIAQNRHLKQIRPWRPYRDSLYLPRGEYVRLLSLGYDMLMADFIWLRAIQAFGGHFLGDKDYSAVINLFDVITDLNPYFISAYLFGNTVIGEEAGDFKEGLELIDKGISKALRYTYRLGYWGGFDSIWNLKDYKRGKYYYQMALKCPDAPDYLPRLLTYVDEKMGNYRIAFEKRLEDLLIAIDNDDKLLQQISRTKIIDVIQQWHIALLHDAARRYKEQFGKDLKHLNELLETGTLGSYQAPVFSRLEERINQYSAHQEKLFPHYREILDYSVVNYNNELPEEPQGTWYFVVYGQKTEDEYFITSASEMRERIKLFLAAARQLITEYKEKNGKFPSAVKDLYPEVKEELIDPFGNPWLYNPQTGELKCSTFSEL